MQIIVHKNRSLTIVQKFFIEKSLELLYLGSIDSYRVKLNNTRSALEELKYCLVEYENGRIKHFLTIKAKEKGKKSLVDEATDLLKYSANYINFNSISKRYIEQLLTAIDEYNYKRVITAIDVLLTENTQYLDCIFDGLTTLLNQNDHTISGLEAIDRALGSLFSELINRGYSKGFLYRYVYSLFVHILNDNKSFDDHYTIFRARLSDPPRTHLVIFRIDTTQKVFEAISEIPHSVLTLTDDLNEITLGRDKQARELFSFNSPANARKFIRCEIEASDYLSALKKARSVLSEYLDVINLGLADEFLHIHQRTLVIDRKSPEKGDFQNNINILDGKYRVEKAHYIEFTRKLPEIISNDSISTETKEKIKSAIRYLRLGNQSTEVEHKFINYWIGLEYLFSNYESHNTISRIKDHFINAHSLAYVKRNVLWLKKAFSQVSSVQQAQVPAFSSTNDDCWKNITVYEEISSTLLNEYPLISYRASKLKQWFFQTEARPNASDYLKNHRENLEIHFTRIYRLRNEIIHDAATDTNNEQIASNLRYYLTFILNEIINFLSDSTRKEITLEDYFISNEIKLGNIGHNGYQLADLLDLECAIDFIS